MPACGPRPTQPDRRELGIIVRDSGPGLAEADRAGLFQPYAQGEQGRRARQGAGLGLAICAQIVQALSGHLSETPQPPGQGACFELSLPVDLAPAQEGSDAPISAALPH